MTQAPSHPALVYPLQADLPGMPPALARRQLHVVLGKGGVGKSTVALALALGLHRQGRSVLLCQVNTPDAHGPLLGSPVDHELREARRGLTVVNIEPAHARREYVMMVLKFRAVYDAVFENKVVQYFLRFIPALAELNVMGKVWFHAQESTGDKRRFDHVVLDAPATGHGLGLLKVARVLSSTAPPGPLRTQTEQMAALFEDAQRTAVHVVTTPDELSVLETLELQKRLVDEHVAPLGVAVVNRVPPPLFFHQPARAAWSALAAAGGPHAATARVVLERLALELAVGSAAERLAVLRTPVLLLPEATARTFALPDVESLASRLLAPPRVVEAL
jgi:anion-transporting  ArsA/GET3 family ATPase